MPRRLPDFQIDELTSAYVEGESATSLSHRFGIGRNTVYRLLRKAGVERPGVKRDIIGCSFGRLTVLAEADMAVFPGGHRKRKCLCRCECGNELEVLVSSLTTGNTQSCGCYRDELLSTLHLKHGFNRGKGQRSKVYSAWCSMKARCLNPRNKHYKDYGGRGITVCDRWLHSFENFLEDMGERPEGTSLDRYPDTNGNYEPENTRWATAREQGRNKRGSIVVEYQNQRMSLVEFAEMHDIPYEKVRMRYRNKKMPLEEILRELM